MGEHSKTDSVLSFELFFVTFLPLARGGERMGEHRKTNSVLSFGFLSVTFLPPASGGEANGAVEGAEAARAIAFVVNLFASLTRGVGVRHGKSCCRWRKWREGFGP